MNAYAETSSANGEVQIIVKLPRTARGLSEASDKYLLPEGRKLLKSLTPLNIILLLNTT